VQSQSTFAEAETQEGGNVQPRQMTFSGEGRYP
jgi:hypothetical protein